VKITETASSIECGGLRLKIEKKGFDCTSKVANRSKYTAAESAECWNRQSLMIKMVYNDAGQ